MLWLWMMACGSGDEPAGSEIRQPEGLQNSTGSQLVSRSPDPVSSTRA